ncbi:MAG: serine hydrolase [Bacillus sp. (in: firmicutes)]
MSGLQIMHEKIRQEIRKRPGKFAYIISHGDEQIAYKEETVHSAASTIKVPLLIEAFRRHEAGLLELEKMIAIGEQDIVGGAGVLQALSLRSATVKDLLTLMVIVSDNTATNLVIDLIGLEEIKTGYNTLGLYATSIHRRMMDFASLQRGYDNVISAKDLHRSLRLINESGLLSEASREAMLEMLGKQQFRDKLPYEMNEESLWIGNKTGELPGIEHDCGIITYEGNTVYAALLCSELDNQQDGQQLIRYVGRLISEYMVSFTEEGLS